MADEDVVIEEQVEEPAADQVAEPAAEETTEEQAAAEESGEKESKTLLSGDEGDGDGEDESTGAPEEYEFTPPDGVEIDEERLEAFGEYAYGLGLSQDQFQKLIEYDIERTANAQQSMAEAYSERISSWADATSSKPFAYPNCSSSRLCSRSFSCCCSLSSSVVPSRFRVPNPAPHQIRMCTGNI